MAVKTPVRKNLTDRAKRYRAQHNVTGPKVCVICGSDQNVGVMHLDGVEDHGEPSNLAWGCKSCNGLMAAEFKRAGFGKPTNQYNPAYYLVADGKSSPVSKQYTLEEAEQKADELNLRRGAKVYGVYIPDGKARLGYKANPAKKAVPTFEQYAWAVSQQQHSGDHGEYGAVIHATPKKLRAEYARQIIRKATRTRRDRDDERWNPGKGKKRNPAGVSAEVFEEFHGFAPRELVTVEKRVHHHQHLAAAGRLVGLQVKPIDGGKVRTIEGLGKRCFLAFNETKNQLFVEGGNQALTWDDLKAFGIRAKHELQTLGKLIGVAYHTDKTHLGDEGGEAIYSHTFRTTNENGAHVTVKIARYPDLIYRVLDEQFEVSGGDYLIRREGIDK